MSRNAEEMTAARLPTVESAPTRELHPALRRRWTLVLILGGLAAFGPLSLDMYLPALPRIAADLGSTATAVQLSLTACLAGLAIGQLVAGPLSDSLGRRLPLLAGVLGYVVTSVLCALAPSVTALVAFRLLQGVFGSAGLVVGRAIVRDLYSNEEAARFFSLLMLVFGLAPILAPVLGGQLLLIGDWRLLFGVLAGMGMVALFGAFLWIPETWPKEHRHEGGPWTSLRVMAGLLRDRVLVGYALASGLAFAAMFAYIAGSPFVLQNTYGVSPQFFGYIFGLNALGLVVVSQINGWLVGRLTPRALLGAGLATCCLAGLAILLVVGGRIPGLPALLVPLFVLIASLGLVAPNATVLAMAHHREAAGGASALLGLLQLLIGALTAPLVGLAGPQNALPMALVIAATAVGAVVTFLAMTGLRSATR